MKQKSTDRHVNIITNVEKTASLEKNHIRKLSNSTQNLQSVQLSATENLQTKNKQKNSLYAKAKSKQRSNTEEILPNGIMQHHVDDSKNINNECIIMHIIIIKLSFSRK